MRPLSLFLLLFIFNIQTSFCQQPDSSLGKAELIPQRQKNFTVYKIRPQIYLIRESACFEEVNCYLFVGKEKCLLFDSGLGIGNIKEVIDSLTHLPMIVINSHTHYDHINGNYLFGAVAGLNNDYSKKNATGLTHEALLAFYKQAYLPSGDVVSCIPADYFIRPFVINKFIADKDKIKLGGITLEIITTPGHTPDGICLILRKDSLLFSGDLVYKGTLFLHLPESNFDNFSNAIVKLNAVIPSVKNIMPAHGDINLEVSCVSKLAENIREIKDGKASFTERNGIRLFNFTFFKILLKKV